jgi:hypothetical protein
MELTAKELQEVIKEVLKAMKEDGEKGRDGYKDEDTQPRGFSKSEVGDYSRTSEEGNRYKRQGDANFGPYTESVLREFISMTIRESVKIKPMPNSKAKASAPFNQAKISFSEDLKIPAWTSTKKESAVWEELGRWFDIPGAKKSNGGIKKMESNILQNVYGERKKKRKKK